MKSSSKLPCLRATYLAGEEKRKNELREKFCKTLKGLDEALKDPDCQESIRKAAASGRSTYEIMHYQPIPYGAQEKEEVESLVHQVCSKNGYECKMVPSSIWSSSRKWKQGQRIDILVYGWTTVDWTDKEFQ